MYLRRCEGDLGAFRVVVLFRKIVGAEESHDTRKPGGSIVLVAVSPFAPPDAADDVAMAGYSGMSTTRGPVRLHCFVGAVCAGILVLFTLRWLLYIIRLLVLKLHRARTFKVADTTTNVALAIAGHCLQGGTTSRDTAEWIRV